MTTLTPTPSDEEERAYRVAIGNAFEKVSYNHSPDYSEAFHIFKQGFDAGRADERSRQAALPVESGKVEGELSRADWCEISKIFNAYQNLPIDDYCRINKWLKAKLADFRQPAAAHPQPSSEEPSEQDIERVAIAIHNASWEHDWNDSSPAERNIGLNAAKAAILSYLKKD